MTGKRKTKKAKEQKPELKLNFRFLNWLLPLVGIFLLIYIGISLYSRQTGIVGFYLADFFNFYFGQGAVFIILTLLYFFIGFMRLHNLFLKVGQIIGFFLSNLALLAAFVFYTHWRGEDIGKEIVFRKSGGLLGSFFVQGLLPILGNFGLLLLLFFLIFLALCLVTKKQPQFYFALIFLGLKKSYIFIKNSLLKFKASPQKPKTQNQIQKSEEKPVFLPKAIESENTVKTEIFTPSEQHTTIEHLQEKDQSREKSLSPIRLIGERLAHLSQKKDKDIKVSDLGEDAAPKETEDPDSTPLQEMSFRADETEAESFELEEYIPMEADTEIVYPLSVEQEKDLESEISPNLNQGSPEIFVSSFYDEPLPEFGDGEPMETVLPAEHPNRYHKPSLNLLTPGQPLQERHYAELEEKTKALEETLAVFGVKSKVVNVSYGPTITRYELQLAPGIRVHKVANLADDIALSLAAAGVRIEAPIPGKPAIGIEVPNKEINIVTLHDVLGSSEFQDVDKGVVVALGKDIAGRTVVADLSKMPHLLIAGATGSGKSVCMNCMITGLLYRFTPEQIKLIMIDPKVVEMANYNGIPHLLAPVVTDPKKAAGVLKSVTREMDRRYEVFAAFGVKNIGQFNEKVLKDKSREPMPYWVVFIDELADLMIVARDEVEESIIRIAQLARAAGIHLVIGTQRPSSDIITGSIKANIPSRIAFAVSSGVDSRIILDMNGAEKLLGRGDMLFQPMGLNKPIRVQGAFISEGEVEAVVEHVKQQGVPVFDQAILTPEDKDEDEELLFDVDELFMEAASIVIETGQGSVSYLQRRLRVGHSRAGRIMDQLEENGIVGPPQGSKPREVLISKEQLENKFGS